MILHHQLILFYDYYAYLNKSIKGKIVLYYLNIKILKYNIYLYLQYKKDLKEY